MKYILVLISLTACASFQPTFEHPAPNLWCASVNVLGEELMLCDKSQFFLQQKVAKIKAK